MSNGACIGSIRCNKSDTISLLCTGKGVGIAYVTLERVTFSLGWAEGVSTFITMGSPEGVPPGFFLCTGKNQR